MHERLLMVLCFRLSFFIFHHGGTENTEVFLLVLLPPLLSPCDSLWLSCLLFLFSFITISVYFTVYSLQHPIYTPKTIRFSPCPPYLRGLISFFSTTRSLETRKARSFYFVFPCHLCITAPWLFTWSYSFLKRLILLHRFIFTTHHENPLFPHCFSPCSPCLRGKISFQLLHRHLYLLRRNR